MGTGLKVARELTRVKREEGVEGQVEVKGRTENRARKRRMAEIQARERIVVGKNNIEKPRLEGKLGRSHGSTTHWLADSKCNLPLFCNRV